MAFFGIDRLSISQHRIVIIEKKKCPYQNSCFSIQTVNKILDKLCSQKIIEFNKKLNAKQTSIEVALIPHVRSYKYMMLKLTCAAEIKR
jgi:hypothetical protein